MALDNRCRAPVLVCCNFFQPTSCRHAARLCTGGVVYSPPCIMRCMTGVRFLCMDVLRCHGIYSRTVFQGKNQYLRLVLDWRQSFLRFPVMFSRAGGSNGKSVPWISPPREIVTVTRWRVSGCPAYCRRTHTLIRKSVHAAHIFIKYPGCGAHTLRFNR
jgi:hypothetical protein